MDGHPDLFNQTYQLVLVPQNIPQQVPQEEQLLTSAPNNWTIVDGGQL